MYLVQRTFTVAHYQMHILEFYRAFAVASPKRLLTPLIIFATLVSIDRCVWSNFVAQQNNTHCTAIIINWLTGGQQFWLMKMVITDAECEERASKPAALHFGTVSKTVLLQALCTFG